MKAALSISNVKQVDEILKDYGAEPVEGEGEATPGESSTPVHSPQRSHRVRSQV
jgi:hypothetical protein